MADTDNKVDSGPQAMLRGLLIVVAVAVIAVVGVLLFTKKTPGGSPLGGSSQGTQQVAMLDSEAIYALPEFTKAKKDLEEPIVEMENPALWGGKVTLANGWQLELPVMAADTPLPITVEARKL